MIDFEISQDELAKAVRQMTKTRTPGEQELVDLTCYRDNIKFVVTGRELTCHATVELKGMARMPLAILPKLRKAAVTFGDKPLRIRIEAGRIRVNSMSIALDGITIQKMSDRPIDIPDNASVCDILALKYVFTKDEVAESDLTARFLAANSERQKAVDRATELLATFGVPHEVVDSLVTQAIKAHAEILRPMLRPAMISDRPN
jgi:hypothetical protein